MSKAEDRLQGLESLVAEQQSKLSKGLKTTIIVYIILVVVVLGYTSFVASEIKRATSKTEIAALIQGQLEAELPARRAELMSQLNDNSEQYAKDSVEYLVRSVPELENQLQMMMDQYTDLIIDDLQTELMPQFAETMRAHAPQINSDLETLTDEEVVQGIVEIFMETIETEMDKYVNDHLIADFEKLEAKLNHLADPNAELTNSEDAQRRVIMYWTYLTEVTEVGESPFKPILQELNDRYRFFSGEDMEQLNTPIIDVEDE